MVKRAPNKSDTIEPGNALEFWKAVCNGGSLILDTISYLRQMPLPDHEYNVRMLCYDMSRAPQLSSAAVRKVSGDHPEVCQPGG